MSRAWRGGSTTAWRKLRRIVLDRDQGRCQVPIGLGQLCGAPANTVGHVTPRSEGSPLLAPLDQLRAECGPCNYSHGARLGNSQRRDQATVRRAAAGRWGW